MNAEKRTEIAITMTREILASMFDNPFAMAFMTFYEVEPEELENKIAEVLEYLDKTTPEEAEVQ